MKFTLRRPCKHCPFRSDIPPFLSMERAEEIVEALVDHQRTFTCHETTVAGEEDEDGFSQMIDGPNAQHCAGAMILLEKIERPNQLMRIAERFGDYDRTKLDMEAPVFDEPDDFVNNQRLRRPR